MDRAGPPAVGGKDAEGGLDVDIADIQTLHNLSSAAAKEEYSHPQQHRQHALLTFFTWYSRWALAGLGMFSEAYIVFSLGQIKPFQNALFPTCFKTFDTCPFDIVHSQNYIQICGIIAGMLIWGFLADLTGRKWGSRIVSAIMLTGCILLTATSFATGNGGLNYLNFFIVAEVWYGFGVGGEYPLAASSAAERAQADPELEHLRGREVVLTFSGQGQGNLVNGIVILLSMMIFDQTEKLTPEGSRNVMALQFAVGCAFCLFMVVYRFNYLHESEVWSAEHREYEDLAAKKHMSGLSTYFATLKMYWPRLVATTMAWVANDFAFYGNKIFQSTFITLLYPGASNYVKQQWTILNSAIALSGYFMAAWLIDKHWYGRKRMQNVGFIMMFILFLICGGAYPTLVGSQSGLHWFQFLYFFSSFWNQFGPNCTTWLVAGEVYPTDVRAAYHGVSAAMGKVGAIIADIAFGYVDSRTTFYLSAAFGLFGAFVTWLFLPDTTGLSLDELDRFNKYMLAGELEHYHGEAINPKHLSTWEKLMKWHSHYDPVMDSKHRMVQELSEGEKAAIHEAAMAHNHNHPGSPKSIELPTTH